MGILSGVLGNASEVDLKGLEKTLGQILIEGEQLERAYKVIRDMFVFTNKRLILIDKQGVTGKKAEYRSIPYNRISNFSIESSGRFDLDAELKIWISGMGTTPIEKQFKKDKSIFDIQKILAAHVLS